MKDGWIIVPHWERFQHYRDRGPAWIKLYSELNSSDEWRALTYALRGLCTSIWIEYARSRGALPVRDLGARCGQRVDSRALEALNHAGFITFSASKPLAHDASPRALAREEKREPPKGGSLKKVDRRRANQREQHGDQPQTTPAVNGAGSTDAHAQVLAAASELAASWNGGSTLDFDNRIDNLQRELQARLTAVERDELWESAFHVAPAPDSIVTAPSLWDLPEDNAQ